jgi:Deuterolysin metalloprotease (M35) family
MRAFASLPALALSITPALSYAIHRLERREAGLTVELTQLNATEVNAVMTNAGSEALKLLDYGTFMDTNPVQKLNVFKNGKRRSSSS